MVKTHPWSTHRSGDYVTVSWFDVPNPTDGDAVVMFLNDTEDFGAHLPIRYKWVTTTSTWPTGQGSFQFQVLNYRAPVRFHYFHNASIALDDIQPRAFGKLPLVFTDSTYLMSSPAVGFAEYYEPQHAHLALTGVPGEMLVQWTSAGAEQPMLRWGDNAVQLASTIAANSTTYNASNLCPGSYAAGSGYINPGYMHTALVRGLQADTTYYYSVGDAVCMNRL